MARLLRPVTNIMWRMPAAYASSTAYWISGLSTMGSISLGWALVAGRKRLPRPATGNTAFLTGFIGCVLGGTGRREQREQGCFVQDGDAQFLGLGQFAAGVGTGHHVGGLLRHRS